MEFEYKAFDMNGRAITGVRTADSADSLASSLKSTGATSVEATPVRIEKRSGGLVAAVFTPRSVSSAEKAVFTRQLGTILEAGVLLTEALDTISTDLENEYFAGILRAVLFHIRSGETLSAALARHPSVFSPYYVAVVRSGEEIGSLSSTMASLATFMEDYEGMRQKLISAIRYPIFLLSFIGVIVACIVLILIPKFKTIFEGAGVKLPVLTRIVVGVSEFFLRNFAGTLVAGILLGALSWRLLKLFKVRFIVDYYLLKLPVVGKVIHKAMLARFCRTSAMLLAGGVGIIKALSLASEVTVNLFLKQIMGEVGHSVSNGASLGEAMRPHRDFPRILIKMVAVGEKAGKLDEMFRRMADYYDREVEAFISELNSLLEPVCIILIGSVVAVVAIALYLPIFSLSGAVR